MAPKVLALIGQGRSYRLIGREVGFSKNTVADIVGRTLKNVLKPHLREQWVIPPAANVAFVAAMEDILAVYTRPRDPDRPLVC